MPPTIRVIGSLNADMVSITPRFPSPGETITSSAYFISAGGKGANQAVACGRLSRPQHSSSSTTTDSDVTVEMVGAVGGLDGHFNSLLKPTLEKSGVDTSRVQAISDAYTGVAVIIVDSSAGGENRILFSPGANYAGMDSDATPDILGLALAAPVPDVIVMQGEIPIETTIGILRDIARWKGQQRTEGKKGIDASPDVIFNPAPAPPGGLPAEVYGGVDHLIMNETEAGIMTPPWEELLNVPGVHENQDEKEKVARYFHSLGVTYVLVTLGAAGVWYSAADAGSFGEAPGRVTNHIPAAKVSRVLDTTAAGDTFVGAYAVKVARWRERRRVEGKGGVDLTTEEKGRKYGGFMGEAMAVATRASARCVERQGAMDSIPWEDEI
ncbi:hypothetical protein BDV12DRAFT_171907 [Aspergillus spectabilis]